MIQIIDAIRTLVPNAECTFSDTKIGRWHDSRPQPTQAEIDAKIAELQAAEPMRLLRMERNQLLAQTDWRMTTDYPYEDQDQWASYRTSLRNLPESAEPTLDEQGNLIVDWPQAPDSV